jgi:glycerol-3-phosphate acyltransferase PlsY
MLAIGIIAVIIGYLLGSIPFAYIAARLIKGVDIRRVGGGNVGALNIMREIGTVAGWAVLLADMGKGVLAVLIAQWLGVSMVFVFVAGLAAVAGHSWPVFLGFKGGRGAATALGVLLALAPVEFAISFAIIVIVVLVTSNFRLAIGVGLVFLPLIIWWFGGETSLIIYSLALPLLLGLRNILTFKRELVTLGEKKDLIIDRKFTPWQKRRKQ